MRCYCCQRLLNDFESTRKSKTTGEYLDMCNACVGSVQDQLETIDRTDLSEGDVPDEEIMFDDANMFDDDFFDEEE